MKKVRHVADLRRLIATALWDGAERTSATSFRWDLAKGCHAPVNFTLTGRAPAWGARDKWGDFHWSPNIIAAPETTYSAAHEAPMFVDMAVRCRRCPWCLKRRASLWSLRAKAEIHAASRTWFGTLTLRPEEHFQVLCRAMAKASATGVEWTELSPAEQFQRRHSVISEEITKWLKRIRKESESRLRYCLTAEAHKSGLPHYHILIHERWLGGQVTERQLRRQWKLGHSKFNLTPSSQAAWYVCKYLAKASEARVRASVRYGTSGL